MLIRQKGTCLFHQNVVCQFYNERVVFFMINVTKEAADQLKGALEQQSKEGLYIRIFVSGMG